MNSSHFFLEGPFTAGGCWEGPPFSTELPRRQLLSPAAGEEESDWAASQTTWNPCGWEGEMDRYCRWMDERETQTQRFLIIKGSGVGQEAAVMTPANLAIARE